MVEDAQKGENGRGWDDEIEVGGALDDLIDESAVPTRNRPQNGLDEDRCECAGNPKREGHRRPPHKGTKGIPPSVTSAGGAEKGSFYNGLPLPFAVGGEPADFDREREVPF